ncbi:SNF2-related protein [Actinokineospora sp. G85]|uniref:SNF2-related protein n=1 Tax=Actinokineospora sp. G85 TaxID=3406626 RepID=UPI003C72A3DA
MSREVTIDVGFAAGASVVVRDEEWLVRSCEQAGEGWRLDCLGTSELVKDAEAVFFTDLEPDIEAVDPSTARLVPDDSPCFRRTRLWLESVLRKTPLPLHEERIAVAHRMLADTLLYQRRAVAQALDPGNLRPRLLIADAVGLGKTLEIGMIISELARRGRAERVLVVTPRHVLEQMQHEMWTRFALPLVRLDSDGIQRVRQTLPSSRNPFTFFRKVIVSVDTLKSERYRSHLEKHRWDVVVIDESHNLSNADTHNNRLARVLAPNTDALILASATPHNGRSESFAELVKLLDPTAIVDPKDYTVDDIKHLFVRRHRHSPDVAAEVGGRWAERLEPEVLGVTPTAAEEAVFAELADTWIYGPSPAAGRGGSLFPWTLVKAFLSSTRALIETIGNREPRSPEEAEALVRLRELAEQARDSAKLDALVEHLKFVGVGQGSTRVVVFSERLATLKWLRAELPTRLGMPATAVRMLHGGLPDTEQMGIVDEFKRLDVPVRVLVTGDVASEGINLHAQCHHLVHFDIPWSLIRIEQRNGRIDRYGQEHPPRITALALASEHERLSGDIRVLAKLLEKEHTAHKALGDAASLMRLHDADAEEDAVRRALAAGRNVDEVIPDPDDLEDDFDSFFAEAGQDTPEPPLVIEDYTLFRSDLDFLREAVHEVYADPARRIKWAEHPQDGTVELTPPADLLARLSALPQTYLKDRKVHERMVLAVDATTGREELIRARRTSATSWPEAHFLGPLHPVLDWAADKALSRFGRGEIPVLAADVEYPFTIGLATLSNMRGQVVQRVLMGFSFFLKDVDPAHHQEPELLDMLRKAGVRDGGINTGSAIDVDRWQPLVPRTVDALRAYITSMSGIRRGELLKSLMTAQRRIDRWKGQSLQLTLNLAPSHKTRVIRMVENHGRLASDVVKDLYPRDEPMLRVLAVIVPREGTK